MTTAQTVIRETDIPGLKLLRRGKVRDIYDAGPEHLLIVASDRISAFDVILPKGIPGKGRILTRLSVFWFELLSDLIPNHLVSTRVEDLPEPAHAQRDILEGRVMLVRKAEPMLVECVARGYLTGSGLVDVRANGHICGHELPRDTPEAARLDSPIFTPATKAEAGSHDENIDFERACGIVGADTAAWLRDMTLEIYQRARAHGEARGIIVADTKFEFGRLEDGSIILIDEVLTPDASRFWNASEWKEGQTPASYDKQVVRNYLLTLDWDRKAPGPELPQEIVDQALARYEEIASRLMS